MYIILRYSNIFEPLCKFCNILIQGRTGGTKMFAGRAGNSARLTSLINIPSNPGVKSGSGYSPWSLCKKFLSNYLDSLAIFNGLCKYALWILCLFAKLTLKYLFTTSDVQIVIFYNSNICCLNYSNHSNSTKDKNKQD